MSTQAQTSTGTLTPLTPAEREIANRGAFYIDFPDVETMLETQAGQGAMIWLVQSGYFNAKFADQSSLRTFAAKLHNVVPVTKFGPHRSIRYEVYADASVLIFDNLTIDIWTSVTNYCEHLRGFGGNGSDAEKALLAKY